MSKYAAQIDNNTVTQVIRGDADWATERFGGTWIPSEEKVGTGWTYTNTDGFRTPQPYPSWTWDNGWVPPVPQPDGEYYWDEDSQQWVVWE